jgi:hypothetical protein
MQKNKPRVIAFYLPQFHPTKDNNEWYGRGFTEWTNVAKAKKLFIGHEQPHIPSDLGFYDLRLESTRIEQAEMAKEYGIEGFCYYHYWFSPTRQELELPFNEVLTSGKPNFPFMLCWANETWLHKFWNLDGSYEKKDLVIQTYGGKSDYIKHFYDILPALKDRRYIHIDGKPAFMILKPLQIPDLKTFLDTWDELAKQNGLQGIFFMGQSVRTDDEYKHILSSGIEIVNSVRHMDNTFYRKKIVKIISKLIRMTLRIPLIRSYKHIYHTFITNFDAKPDVVPTIIPNWDHTPRSGRGGYVITGSTPALFRLHLQDVFSVLKTKPRDRQIVFLKSWNEWGEGNYMEPDLKYGNDYLHVLKEEIDNY